jgi:hypothetical protein
MPSRRCKKLRRTADHMLDSIASTHIAPCEMLQHIVRRYDTAQILLCPHLRF